jgi:hypothetical protein
METPPQVPSKTARWIGYILTTIPVLMLVMSAVMKLLKPQPVVDGFVHLGIPLGLVAGLGVLELLCTVIYLIPATSILGAILLTGYLGGAILTTLRVGDAYYGAALLGISLWAGLYLREPKLRSLIPFRK